MSIPHAKKIIPRVKQVLDVRTDAELAERLGVSHPTIAAWKARNNPDFRLIIDACLEAGANLHWVVTGTGMANIEEELELARLVGRLEQANRDTERRLSALEGK